MLKYYTYCYNFGMEHTNRYTPSYNFCNQFPQLIGVCTMTDEIIPEDKFKILPNGERFGYRVGIFEYDEALLVSLGMDIAYIQTKAQKVYSTFDLENRDNDNLYEWIKTWATLEEVSPGKFLLSEETEMMGEIIPAKYLIID